MRTAVVRLLLLQSCALALMKPRVHRPLGPVKAIGASARGRPVVGRGGAVVGAAEAAGEVGGGGEGGGWLVKHRTKLLFGALVAQKVLADTLTDVTRRQGAYSGSTVSMLSEVAKFPVLAVAICVFGGGAKRLAPTARRALSDTPLKIAWIAGAYAAQNVLYFAALGRISAASYQVLSQSKMIFTAVLAVTMLGERLTARKVGALAALLAGSLLVQVSEMGGVAFGSHGAAEALLGGGLTVLGALLSAVPNVWYEKILKTEGEDEWARNVQVTCWIFSWIAASQLGAAYDAFRTGASAVAPWASPRAFAGAMFGSMEGITPAVWCVVALKSLNGILIPATLKYAGNLVYLYAKPTSIVATAAAAAVYARAPPSPAFCAGAALVIFSMFAGK